MIELLLSMALADPDITYRRGQGEIEICGLSSQDPIALIGAVMEQPNIRLIEQTEEYITWHDKQAARFWTIAINNHPAAPAIICRTINQTEDAKSSIAMEVRCFAEKSACDKLVSDFRNHNQRIVEQVTE